MPLPANGSKCPTVEISDIHYHIDMVKHGLLDDKTQGKALLHQLKALGGWVNNTPIEYELLKQPDQGWYEPPTVVLLTGTRAISPPTSSQ